MGALSYVPESYIGEEKSLPDLDNLQQMALEVLSENLKKAKIFYISIVVIPVAAVLNACGMIVKVHG